MKIYLDKHDLIERFKTLPIEDIEVQHFRSDICPLDVIKRARYIEYQDKGKGKILKDARL